MGILIIAIDFDGTIVNHEYPRIGEPVPNAIEWIKKFRSLGADIILYTMRSGDQLDEAISYLDSKGITDLYGYNTNPDQHLWTDSPKIYAHKYIDDAAVGCPLIKYKNFNRMCVDWNELGDDVVTMISEYG